MASNTRPTRYRSGNNVLYVSNRFIYEVSLYKLTKSSAALVKSQYYASDQPLSEESLDTKYVELDANTTLAKFIDWLAAPVDYLVKHNYHKENGNDNVRRRGKSNPRKGR